MHSTLATLAIVALATGFAHPVDAQVVDATYHLFHSVPGPPKPIEFASALDSSPAPLSPATRRGAWIGALIGGVGLGVASLVFIEDDDGVPPAAVVTAVGLGGVGGGLLGALIGAMWGER